MIVSHVNLVKYIVHESVQIQCFFGCFKVSEKDCGKNHLIRTKAEQSAEELLGSRECRHHHMSRTSMPQNKLNGIIQLKPIVQVSLFGYLRQWLQHLINIPIHLIPLLSSEGQVQSAHQADQRQLSDHSRSGTHIWPAL